MRPCWRGRRSTLKQRATALAEFQARIEEDVLADGVGSIAAAWWSVELVWLTRRVPRSRARLDAQTDTIYRIGSISKSVTAVALMVLVQRVLALDDPVAKHLPESPDSAAASPRRARSRCASRQPRPGSCASRISWMRRLVRSRSEQKILASIPVTTLRSKPGTEHAYSNIGYGILGLAISRAAKEPFMDLVRRSVFEPLGMTSSSFVIAPPLDARLALGYQNDREGNVDGRQAALEHAGRGYKVPNGGVYSTVADLGRFIALESRPGRRRAGARLQTEMPDGRRPKATPTAWASSSTDLHGNRFVAHDGVVAGYTAQILPSGVRTGVLLRNTWTVARTSGKRRRRCSPRSSKRAR